MPKVNELAPVLAVLDTDVCVCGWMCVLNLISLPPPAVCHSYNLLCCLSPDCRYCHANQGATHRKGEQNRMDRSFLYLALHTALSAPPTLLPSSYLPFISLVPHFIHPSFYVFCNRCNNRLIWKTLNYHASASSAHINAAATEQQIKLAENGRVWFGESAIIRNAGGKKPLLHCCLPGNIKSPLFLVCMRIRRLG